MKPAPITVPPSFTVDFKYYCSKAGLDRYEQDELRNRIRMDFAGAGGWVTEMAEVYRFCEKNWLDRMPTPDQCRGYLESLRWWPEDETIFRRLGILLLAQLCRTVYLEKNPNLAG